MKCKHCGKELVSVGPMYLEAGFFSTAGAPAYLPINPGTTIFFPNAAAAPCVGNTFTPCFHEPRSDATPALETRPAVMAEAKRHG